jgi:hypothetical protein
VKPQPEVPIWKQLALLGAFSVFLVALVTLGGPNAIPGLGLAFVLTLIATVVWQLCVMFNRR